MNQEIKTKWVAALRSGNYRQGRDQLRPDSNVFCCLGVLCEIVDPSGWDKTLRFHHGHELKPDSALLDQAVVFNEDIDQLVYMNDSLKASFSGIADWIEENL